MGLSSKTLPEQQLFDLGNNFLRTQLTTVQGAATPYPYGGKPRQIQVDLDAAKLQTYGLAPADIVNAVAAQNLILPAGTTKIGPTEYNVEMNGTPRHDRRAERSAGEDHELVDALSARCGACARRIRACKPTSCARMACAAC